MPATAPTTPNLDIVLTYPPLGLIHAIATHYNDREMAVSTGRISLKHNSEVEITFTSRTGRRMLTHRITAHVLSSNESESRLTFHQCSEATLETLRRYKAR